jgi:hypothetical protein
VFVRVSKVNKVSFVFVSSFVGAELAVAEEWRSPSRRSGRGRDGDR